MAESNQPRFGDGLFFSRRKFTTLSKHLITLNHIVDWQLLSHSQIKRKPSYFRAAAAHPFAWMKAKADQYFAYCKTISSIFSHKK